MQFDLFIVVDNTLVTVPVMFKEWQKKFSWLELNSNKRSVCLICKEATEKKLVLLKEKKCENITQSFC